MQRVAIYNRCSTDEEAQKNALEVQAAESLELVKENAAKEIYNIGDSNISGKVFTAVKSAYRKAITI